VAVEGVGQPLELQPAPVRAPQGLDPGLHGLLALFQALVVGVAARLELVEAVPRQRVELQHVTVVNVNAAGSATGEQVLAVEEVERDQVPGPLLVVVRGPVQVLPEPQARAECRGAGRRVVEGDLRHFVAGSRGQSGQQQGCRGGDCKHPPVG